MDKKYQVFVSSTYEDLKPARERVRQSLLEFGAIPAAMEQFSAGDDDQWTKIKRVIDQCDYYMVIIGGMYGSTDEDGMSYTEKEYRYALEKKKPIAAFVHGNPDQLPAAFVDADTEKNKRLDAFRDLVTKKMCKFWLDPAELGGHTTQSIIELIDQRPAIGWVRGDNVVAPNANAEILRVHKGIEELNAQVAEAKKLQETATYPEQTAWTDLSDEAQTMLVAMSKDDRGTLIDASHMGGTEFLTGGKNLIPDQSPRTIARWKSALSQLETNELIEETAEGVFKITSEGFDTADKIGEAEGRSRANDAVPREPINQQETADNLRTTIIWAERDWTDQKESDPKNTDDGELIIQRLGESLHGFRDHLANSIPEGIGPLFDNVIRDARLIQRRGQSSTFWRMGDHIIENAKKLGIDVALAIAADEDPSYSGPYKGYSAEELQEVLVQFLKGREAEAFQANLGSLDPPSGSFMAGELIHFRQLDEMLHLLPGTSRTLLREAAREFKLKIKKATSNTIQFE